MVRLIHFRKDKLLNNKAFKNETDINEHVKIIENEVNEYYHKHKLTSDLLELRNIIEVSNLIIKSALIRKESRGLHYSIDYPKKNIASQLIGKFSHNKNSKGLWGVELSMNEVLKSKIDH